MAKKKPTPLRKKQTVYVKVRGSHVKGDAQAIGEVIARLKKKHGGDVPPKELVKLARNPKNPCHKNFTWDDTKAAEAYRMNQARHLLRSIIVMEVDRESVTFRPNVVCTRYGGQKTQNYRDFMAVMSNPREREMLLDVALREFQTFRNKYERLSELSEMFAAYDRLLSRKKRLSSRKAA